MKECKKCNIEKPEDSFRKAKDRRGIMVFRHTCRECERAASIEYEKENKDKRLAEKRAFYLNNSEKEKQRKIVAYWKNPEKEKARAAKWRDKNREYLREKDRKNAKERPAYFSFKTQKRHTAKLQRTPPWLSAKQWQDIKTEYELASWCSKVQGQKYHVDHIVPLQGKQVCGLHVPWNLQVIPATDNMKKSNKHNEY